MSFASNLKLRVKQELLKRLHASEAITLKVANRVLEVGVPARLSWTFEQHRADVLGYMQSCHRGGFDYAFARSVETPTLYGSSYAFMLTSMLGAFEGDTQIAEWIDHFDGFQDDDGLFRDPVLAGDAFEHRGGWGEGWGAKHLLAQLVTSYARAGRAPTKDLRFLEPFYDPDALSKWLQRFHFRDQLWSQSNHVMNLFIPLQFARDFMNEPRAGDAVEQIAEWLREKQNSATGMWHDKPLTTRAQANDAIRAAYHYFPLFEYDRTALPFHEQAIDAILPTQNSWGCFEEELKAAGACEDIDALDPLLRFASHTGHRSEDVRKAAERSFIWLLACQYPDGGSASQPGYGFHYGNHPLTTSKPGEANLFGTWFRTLTLAYVTSYLGVPQKFQLGHFPGYEIVLPKAAKSANPLEHKSAAHG